jgi:hypothetical protein
MEVNYIYVIAVGGIFTIQKKGERLRRRKDGLLKVYEIAKFCPVDAALFRTCSL